MAFCESIIALAAFLSFITAVVFIMLVIGIHKGDRARHLSDTPDTPLDALTRNFLGVGTRCGPRDEN